MTTTVFKQTSVDVTGLLKVLGENLYSRPEVAVRELVQNASDAIARRKLQGDQNFSPRIQVDCSSQDKTMTITDNGSGLTDEEIELYLARIGTGFTRSLRKDTESSDLIGAFGLGFLTAYMIGQRVEVQTTSMSGDAFRFVSENGERYVVTPMARSETGSKVIIRLKDKYDYLSNYDRLRGVLNDYCRLMTIPISVQGGEPINVVPPWRTEISNEPLIRFQRRNMEFAESLEPNFVPICTIPIKTSAGKGIVWIHDRSTYGGADNRWMQIYIRGMMVARNKHDFLPGWAGFMSGVFESDNLSPTASREDIIVNDIYQTAKKETAKALHAGLANLASNQPEIWRTILRRHNQALLGAAISDDDLFQAVHKDLTLPTSEGDMTLAEIAKQSPTGIAIAPYADGGADEIVSRAFGTPVVLGYRYGAAAMTIKYAAMNNIQVIELGTKEGHRLIFPNTNITSDVRNKLESLFASKDLTLAYSTFSPKFLSCLCFVDAEQSLRAYYESDQADQNIGQGALSLARAFTRKIEEKTPLQMVINLGSPIIEELLNLDDNTAAAAASTIASTARMLCKNKVLGADGFAQALETFNNGFLQILESKA